MVIRLIWCLAIASLACGSSTGSDAISVGGSYATAVVLTQNTCGSVEVQPMPTTVAHTPGATTLTLTHAGSSFSGTLNPDASFTTTPNTLNGNGSSFTVSIAGRFSRTGFEADVTVDVQQSVQPNTCRYVVHWTGTKNSGSNVLPQANT